MEEAILRLAYLIANTWFALLLSIILSIILWDVDFPIDSMKAKAAPQIYIVMVLILRSSVFLIAVLNLPGISSNFHIVYSVVSVVVWIATEYFIVLFTTRKKARSRKGAYLANQDSFPTQEKESMPPESGY